MSQDPKTLADQVSKAQGVNKGLPPLEQWHPKLSGDMDMVIARDGEWIYRGEPLKREAIVRLFSTILRREEDGDYYLVTPVEKWRITVEDAPLLAHGLDARGQGETQCLAVTTNVGETLEIGPDHPLAVGTYAGSSEPRPVVFVRHGLEARLVTAAYYDLAERVVEKGADGTTELGVWSNGVFFKIGQGA